MSTCATFVTREWAHDRARQGRRVTRRRTHAEGGAVPAPRPPTWPGRNLECPTHRPGSSPHNLETGAAGVGRTCAQFPRAEAPPIVFDGSAPDMCIKVRGRDPLPT